MNVKTPEKTNAPILLSQSQRELDLPDCGESDIFVADTYCVRVTAYPTNEISIRLNPHAKGSDDADDDRLNKFLANELENGSRKIDSEEEKKKKVKVDKAGLPGWGVSPQPKSFSKRSQKRVERTVAALQAKYGKESTRFMTMTLPGSTVAAMKVMSDYSAYIVNRTNRFIYSNIEKDAGNRVSIWELQKRGALHSHTLIASNNEEGLKNIDDTYKDFCYRLFQDLSVMTGIDMFERSNGDTWKDRPDVLRCNCEAIRVSASSYMSKYMSKSNTKSCTMGDSSKSVFYPSVWASYGRGAVKAMNDRTYRLEDKRIDADGARNLVLKCIELSEKYSQDKYKQPLVYPDKIGYGVNIKTFVKPENLDTYVEGIQDYLNTLLNRKDPTIKYKQASLQMVEKMWADDLDEAIINADLVARYGFSDGRLWQKRFRKNKADLPKFSSDEEWQKYYSER